MTYPQHQPPSYPPPAQHPQQAVYGYAPPALTPDAERWSRARTRHLGFGIAWLIMSALNISWPIVVGGTIFVAVASGGSAPVASEAIVVLGLVYLATFPILMLLSLLTALRSQWLHKRLKPFGPGALAGIIIGWIGFGLAAINVIAVTWTLSFFFTGF